MNKTKRIKLELEPAKKANANLLKIQIYKTKL